MRLSKLCCFVLAIISVFLIMYFHSIEDFASKVGFLSSGSFGNEAKESMNQSQGYIWFLETSHKARLNARQACSIETACRHNSDHIVHLLSTGNITSTECPYHRLLSKLPNFRSSQLNATAELAGTPLAPLHAKGGALHQSPYVVQHLSDFLRYVVLWKHGGVYLDTDVILMKSLKGISNSVFFQSSIPRGVLANAILFFDKHHPFLKAIVDECARVYNPQAWTSCGPDLITPLALDAEFSHRLNFVNESSFFVVPWEKWERLFSPKMASPVLRAVNNSYGVHFWNMLSKNKLVVTGSGSAMDVLARTHCPDVYRLASSEGSF